MRQMFASATVKLTVWYVMIIMTISIVFSLIIFQVSTTEVSNRLERMQIRLEGTNIILPGTFSLNDVRQRQSGEAKLSIFVGLVYINLVVLALGGVGGYLLARKTLEPIEEAHEAQSRFTSDASHELKTPLAVMKSEIEVLMRDKTATKEDYKELLASNLEEVDKLTSLSQALLQLSRLDYSDIEMERVNVYKVLAAAAQSTDKKMQRIVIKKPSKPIVIDGNEAMLRDLWNILFDNALKYSPASTPITADISSNGRTASIAVSNEGEGIAKDDIPHIFERFYRVDRSRTSKSHTKGYGLGLSLAKKIVDFHDGDISVVSTPNKVTTFSILLPQVAKSH